MNTANHYRATLDTVALVYLKNHQAKHLGDEQNLLGLAAAFLVDCYGADKVLAENTVARAVNQLRSAGERRYLDVSTSTGSTAVIVDPASGIAHAVPIALICQLLLDAPVAAS